MTKKEHFLNILVSVDCVGNAISRGNRQSTISGRTFYNSVYSPKQWFWQPFQNYVDTSFYEIDGEGHCRQAFEFERDEEHYDATKRDMFFILLFSIPVCTFIRCFINPVLRRRSK
jgi:hypothetical protein